MLVKTVVDAITTDSAGNVVDPLVVRETDGDDDTLGGTPSAIIAVTEDEAGVPVRVVVGKYGENSAGQLVDAITVEYA